MYSKYISYIRQSKVVGCSIEFFDSIDDLVWFDINKEDGFYIKMVEGTDKYGEYGIGRELTLEQARDLMIMLQDYFGEIDGKI